MSPRPATHLPRALLWAGAILATALAILRASFCWRNDAYLNPPVGAWVTLASDLAHGLLYRPLFGPLGYGGTRYFPLHAALQAALMRLGATPRASGYAIAAFAVGLLLAGTYVLLRRLAVGRELAAVSLGAILAAATTQLALLSIRGDGLAAASNVWGLAACAKPNLARRDILFGAILFTLAWSAKITTVFGLAAVALWLAFSDRRRAASSLLAITAIGFALVLAGIYFGSQGRAWEIFRQCVSGETTLFKIAVSPLHLLRVALSDDPGGLLFFLLGVWVLFQAGGKLLRELPALFFLSACVVTTFIFGTPGTSGNHLVDLVVASVALFVSSLGRLDERKKNRALATLGLATLLAAAFVAHKFVSADRAFPPHRFTRALAAIGQTRRPILAENPLVPLLAGERPYLVDPWMFRVLAERTPAFGDPLWTKLREKRFGAVVLETDARAAKGQRWYRVVNFGDGFLNLVEQNYRLAAVVGGEYIYLPRPDSAAQFLTSGPVESRVSPAIYGWKNARIPVPGVPGGEGGDTQCHR